LHPIADSTPLPSQASWHTVPPSLSLLQTAQESAPKKHSSGAPRPHHLVLRECREVLAVKMGRQYNTPRSLGVLCSDYVGELFSSQGRIIRQLVFFDMPVEVPESRDNIIPYKRIVRRVGCYPSSVEARIE
jgi:hypothetical protein